MEEVWKLIQSSNLQAAEAALDRASASGAPLPEVEYARAVIAYFKRDPYTALHHAGKAIEAEPELVPALNLASQILLDLRDYSKSLEFGQQSLEFRPNDGQVLLIVGRALLGLHRAVEAVGAFLAAMDTVANAQPLIGLASAFQQLESSFDAIEALSAGLEIERDPNALSDLMTLQSEYGEASKALELAKEILAADPSSQIANLVAAKALIDLGSLAEADPYWARAKEANPEAWRVDRLAASALTTHGKFEAAESLLEKSLAAQPNQGGAYHQIFVGRSANAGDQERIDRMEELAQSNRLTPDEQAPLEFALGKAWDDLGDPERAMLHFDRANALRRGPFDRDAFADKFAIHREIFAEQAPTRPGLATELPIFILGMMRSGTTLLEQMLAAHPDVVGAGELDFWPASECLLIDASGRQLIAPRIPNRRAAYLRLLDTVRTDEKRVVDKNPANIVHAGLLNRVFPDAPIIHLRRNPLDTALSIYMTDGSAPFMSSREDIVYAIRQTTAQAEHWLKVLPSNRILDVRYEDLVSEPETWMRQITEFCGLTWSEACLSAHRQARPVSTASVWQVRQPVYKTSVGRAQRYAPWLGALAELQD